MSGAVKTIVTFGGHGYSTGAAFPPLIERDLNLQVDACIEAALERKYTGFRHLRPKLSNDPVRWPLADRAKFARDNQADLFAEIHFNAGGGTRTVMYVHTNATEQDLKLANVCLDKVAPFMATLGVRNGGIAKANFAVLRETPGIPSILPEICFLDHPVDRAAVMSPAFFGLVGELIADGFAEFLGLPAKQVEGVQLLTPHHCVNQGENMWSLARLFGIPYNTFLAHNPHIDADTKLVYWEHDGDILFKAPATEFELDYAGQRHGWIVCQINAGKTAVEMEVLRQDKLALSLEVVDLRKARAFYENSLSKIAPLGRAVVGISEERYE